MPPADFAQVIRLLQAFWFVFPLPLLLSAHLHAHSYCWTRIPGVRYQVVGNLCSVICCNAWNPLHAQSLFLAWLLLDPWNTAHDQILSCAELFLEVTSYARPIFRGLFNSGTSVIRPQPSCLFALLLLALYSKRGWDDRTLYTCVWEDMIHLEDPFRSQQMLHILQGSTNTTSSVKLW